MSTEQRKADLLFWYFEKMPKPLQGGSCLFLIAVVGYLNVRTGWELDFSLFYVAPITFATWFLGIRAGLLACLVCTAVWFLVDLSLLHIYTSEFIHYWNTSIRLSFFVLFSFLLDSFRNAHEREKTLARTDGLTGAANSRSFHEQLALELARSQRYRHPFALAYLDLDNFKTVNDRLGHAAGDRALKTIADYVKMNLRAADVLGRLGGDEFALLLPETDPKTVRTAIAKLHEGLLQLMQRHGWPITFSVGVMTCDTIYPNADDLIKAADELMYTVKNSGKNAVKFGTYPDSK